MILVPGNRRAVFGVTLAGVMACVPLAAQTGPVGAAIRSRVLTPSASPVVRSIPEVLNVFAGGTNTAKANDDGTTDGIPAAQAGMGLPGALVFDSQGNLYEADRQTHVVRRIRASDGLITTVAGIPTPLTTVRQSADAGSAKVQIHATPKAAVPATQVHLQSPAALAVGPDDTLYIADADAQVVYHLDGSGNMTIVAGTLNTSGYSPDGTLATNALLNEPSGLAVDATGALYVADTLNNLVRVVRVSDGTLLTLAGQSDLASGYSGDGNAATGARLSMPQGLVIDRNGRLLIADSQNFVVRQIDFDSGKISTIAGSNSYGSAGDGGQAIAAQLQNPTALAVDAVGDVYISDYDAHLVRVVSPDGAIQTVAGFLSIVGGFNFPGYGRSSTASTLGSPGGVAIDPAGSLYVSSTSFGVVLKAGPSGLLEFGDVPVGTSATQALTIENLGGASFTFGTPAFLATGAATAKPDTCVDGGTLASGARCTVTISFAPNAATAFTETVTVMDSAQNVAQSTTVTGQGVLPGSTTTLGLLPQQAYVGDGVTLSATVASASQTGPVPTGSVTFTGDVFNTPIATASIDPVTGKASITVSTLAAGYYSVAAHYGGDSNYAGSVSSSQPLNILLKPTTIVLSASTTTAHAGDTVSATATVQAADGVPAGNVAFYAGSTVVATVALQSGVAQATFPAPAGGTLSLHAVYLGNSPYASSSSNLLPLTTHGGVLSFEPGAAVTVAGVPGNAQQGAYSGDGPATSSYLHTPSGVASDGAGNVYIADRDNNIIRKVTPDGNMTTVAGVPYLEMYLGPQYGGDEGAATSAYLAAPQDVAVDAAGNLYIADTDNNIIRKVTTDGIIHTIAGIPSTAGYNGSLNAKSAELDHPRAIALDASGQVFVADTGNRIICKLALNGTIVTVAGNRSLTPGTVPVSGQAALSTALNTPSGIAVAADSSLFIADDGFNIVSKVGTDGVMNTIAGGGTVTADTGYGPGLALLQPRHMALDAAGVLYVVEAGQGVVRKLKLNSFGNYDVSTAVGYVAAGARSAYNYLQPSGEPSDQFLLQNPIGLAVEASGALLVADSDNQTVLRVGPAGALRFAPEENDSNPQYLTLVNRGDEAITFAAPAYTLSGTYAVQPANSSCDFTKPLAPGATCALAINNAGGAGTGSVTFALPGGEATAVLTTLDNGIASVTNLAASAYTLSAGDSVTLTATVQGGGKPPVGLVSFYDGTSFLGYGHAVAGSASMTVNNLTQGTHSFTANFNSGVGYAPSQSLPAVVTVNGAATTTTLSVASAQVDFGNPFQLTAVVTRTVDNAPVPSGTVSFYEGSVLLGTSTVSPSGRATLSIALPAGIHSLYAVFADTAGYVTSTSALLGVGVGNGAYPAANGYTLEIVGVPAVVHPGSTVNATVHVQQLGYMGPVDLMCGTLPYNAKCTYQPTQLQLNSQGVAPSGVLTITVTAPFIDKP